MSPLPPRPAPCRDYNGVVTLWDTETKQSVMDVDGHDRRIWSVDFNSCPAGDPTIFLSGSDDCTVKVGWVGLRFEMA